MPELKIAVLPLVGFASAFLGMAWLALSMEEHWRRVSRRPCRRAGAVTMLRLLAVLALVTSLGLALLADHPSMAVIVWIMELGTSSASVAFAIAWIPRSLRILIPWVR